MSPENLTIAQQVDWLRGKLIAAREALGGVK
jgi:hypothetical protein